MATTHHDAHGSEIEGTRITVYTLLPHFLDPSTTEAYICQLYNLSPEQVAAARAYVLNNADVVLAAHLQIEAKRSAGNPPQVVEAAHKTRANLLRFKDWLHEQDVARSTQEPTVSSRTGGLAKGEGLPTFKQWLRERESNLGSMFHSNGPDLDQIANFRRQSVSMNSYRRSSSPDAGTRRA